MEQTRFKRVFFSSSLFIHELLETTRRHWHFQVRLCQNSLKQTLLQTQNPVTFLIRLCFCNHEATPSLGGHRRNAKSSSPNVTSCAFSKCCRYSLRTADGGLRERWVWGKHRRGKVTGCTANETERQEWNEGLGRRELERNMNEDRKGMREEEERKREWCSHMFLSHLA